MKKQIIRLTEQDLHNIIKESVNSIINEIGDTSKGQYMLGRLMAKYDNYEPDGAREYNCGESDDYPPSTDIAIYANRNDKTDRNDNSRWVGYNDEIAKNGEMDGVLRGLLKKEYNDLRKKLNVKPPITHKDYKNSRIKYWYDKKGNFKSNGYKLWDDED